jgi:hypothetical protein
MQITESMYEINTIDESEYLDNKQSKPKLYDKEYLLTDKNRIFAQIGIINNVQNINQYSCIIKAGGGGHTIEKNSAIIVKELLYIAVGNLICCLSLPMLNLEWNCEVDAGICFELFYLSSENCIISHGEQEISRINMLGNKEWSASGKDIFTEGMSIYSDHIEVIDFNHENYSIDIKNGDIHLI